ncbi:protein SCAI-like [Centruroides sculpturatus]|uniref:protein SCAI-like n=1 Tax=Centruroides sculpturatus TaxID=218467 RepID=UPI000C6CED98|nr:protein SCAI-like [Centruroides sculpturatus]
MEDNLSLYCFIIIITSIFPGDQEASECRRKTEIRLGKSMLSNFISTKDLRREEMTLGKELAKQIDDYTATYEPEDQLEWSLVLGEIRSFIEADNLVNVMDVDSSSIVLSHRLSPLNTPPIEKLPSNHLTLQEILIVGNCCDQPENGEQRPLKRENPHKYLLYKPTFSQLFVFLASGFKELPPNGVLLLYLSADGSFSNIKHPDDMGYDYGGVATNSKREPDHANKRNIQLKDMHCLFPGDLYPYTRKPLLLIVDSDNSHAFQHIPRYFGQPVVVLMSPEDVPAAFRDQQHNGSLFTLFLHSPLTALCFICNIVDIPITLWEKGQSHMDRFMSEASRLLTRSRNIDPAYLQFYGDDFLRLLILRFIFCHIVLRLHRLFKGHGFSPRSHPPLPESELLDHPSLRRAVLELAAALDMRSFFVETDDAD